MRILGLETSGDTSSIALLDGGELIAETVFASRQTICQLLTSQILTTLGTATVREADLDGIAVSLGPASFTGLRVGVATAKAIAYCCRIPVVGISTPLAWAAEVDAGLRTVIAVLQPARRGKLYLTAFARAAGPWPQQREETSVIDVADAPGACAALAPGGRPIVTGNALLAEPALSEDLAEFAEVLSLAADSPGASTIARIGTDSMAQAPPNSYFTLRPHYVLVSQAERMHGVDLGL